jgi:tubulin-specific chaperone D
VTQIRIAAAETLWFLTQEEGLRMQDWTLPPKSLKPEVDKIRKSVINDVRIKNA